MKPKAIIVLGVLALGFFVAQPAVANYKMLNGAKDFYFGHISYVEIKHDGKDPVVFREGQARPEVALLNLPLGPGDMIQTSDARRCEVQFDNGTIVRLDYDTELKIETILAPSLSTARKISNLLLAKGQVYIMYKKYDSMEIFQIITPLSAIKLSHHTVAMIRSSKDGTDVQVERGKAQVLYGADKSNLLEVKLKVKERALVTPDHQAMPASYVGESDFYAWNTSVNENFRVLHEESFLPKPIEKLPRAVFYFAQRYGNLYGEWLWHPLYGYVWRPYYNDYYPWGTWHPLYYGRWTVYQGQLFWIPEEPWGWVPYHLGIWMWDPNKGWLWLPGSMFAPAWAVWDFYFGYYFWRAWSLFDWYYGPYFYWPQFGYGFYYGGGYEPDILPGRAAEEVLRTVRKDQLQKKKIISTPIPKEMKKVLQTTLKAMERADASVLSTLREIPRKAVAVKREDLTSPRLRERAVSIERLFNQPENKGMLERDKTPQDSLSISREAQRTIQRSQAIGELEFRALGRQEGKERVRPSDFSGFAPSPSQKEVAPGVKAGGRVEVPVARELALHSLSSGFRFRDWNPDVKTAIQMGVRISYSSRTNEVSCPELGLASRAISLRMRTAGPSFGGFPASTSSGGSGGESSGHSSGSTSPGASSSGASHGGGSHGGSRGGGQPKNN